MGDEKPDNELSDKEISERMERGLRRSFQMPHKPHKPSPPNKTRPASKGRVRKGKSRT
jgi:hypothetical protein